MLCFLLLNYINYLINSRINFSDKTKMIYFDFSKIDITDQYFEMSEVL